MPQILYTWTSGKIGDTLPLPPKKEFVRGDSIQFNVIHSAENDERQGGMYVVTFFHEHLGLTGVGVDESQFDVLSPVKLNIKSPLTRYGADDWYLDRWSMERIPTGVDTLPLGDTRDEAFDRIKTDPILLKLEGYWRFTTFVQVIRADNQRDYDVMDWIYNVRVSDYSW